MFYNPEIFFILKKLFLIIEHEMPTGSVSFEELICGIDGSLTAFLIENNFFHEWEKILRNTPKDRKNIRWAFHTWFDAFKTLKFVHFCEDRYPETSLMDAYGGLLEKSGIVIPETARQSEKKLLEFMRAEANVH